MNIINMEANKDLVMNSHEFLTKIINPAREEAGERPVKHAVLIKRIEDELDDNLPESKIITLALPQGGSNEFTVYSLNSEQLLLVGMRESKGVRKVVLKRLKEYREALTEIAIAASKGDCARVLEVVESVTRHYIAGKPVTEEEYLEHKSKDAGKFTGFKRR